MSCIAGPNSIESGLVVYFDAANFKSYPGSGTSLFDLSRNNKNATLVNGPTYSANNLGTLTLDGTDDFINVAHTQTSVTQYTIEVWVRTSGTAGLQAIVNNRGSGPGQSLTLGMGSSVGGSFGPTSTAGQLFFVFDTNATGIGPYHTGRVFNDGIWHQVVGVLNIPSGTTLTGGNASSYMFLYADGSRITTSLSYWGIGSAVSPYTGSGNTVIGRHEAWSERRFPGSISIVRIYNRALSDTEIRQNFEATRGRFGI